MQRRGTTWSNSWMWAGKVRRFRSAAQTTARVFLLCHHLTHSVALVADLLLGGWTLSHFSTQGVSPFAKWLADPMNPVVRGGQLFSKICAGAGKHCPVGMVDEGTPEIVEKVDGYFIVTFHGYDYAAKAAARGVARTIDFHTWDVGLLQVSRSCMCDYERALSAACLRRSLVAGCLAM
jgi:hypothetical protein